MPPGASTGTLEEGQVRAMFDRIAGLYDVMNSVMTAGLHHRWRERAADLAALGPGDRALDVATGTGDLALELGRRVGSAGEIVGSDFSEGMLEQARRQGAGAGNVRFEQANALALPYADGEFAAATVGFGARNFSDLAQGLREMTRVVRPGGRGAGGPRPGAAGGPAGCGRSTTPPRPARLCRPSSGCGSIGSCP